MWTQSLRLEAARMSRDRWAAIYDRRAAVRGVANAWADSALRCAAVLGAAAQFSNRAASARVDDDVIYNFGRSASGTHGVVEGIVRYGSDLHDHIGFCLLVGSRGAVARACREYGAADDQPENSKLG